MIFKDKKFVLTEKLFYLFSIFLLLIFAISAHTYLFNLDLKIATSGFSILEVIQAHENPIGFTRDYPGGARLTTAASPMVYLYYLGNSLGISSMFLLYVMIFLEMCTLLVGAWLLWKALFDTLSITDLKLQKNTTIAFIWVAFILLLSGIQRANLANFSFPFFHGQFYGFADGLRLAVIAMILRKKWLSSSCLFILCFVIHPIKAVMVAGFVVPIVLLNWRNLINYSFIFAAAFGGIACSLWYFSTLSIGGEAVPLNDFIDFTRIFQSHWYPVDYGLFGKLHTRGISPFMALVLVIIIALEQEDENRSLKTRLYVGLAALIFLIVLGIYFSVSHQSVTLIRISFLRASTLISLLAPLLIIMGVVVAWHKQRWGIVAGLLAFLMASFDPSAGNKFLSPFFAICLVGIHFLYTKKINFVIALITTIFAIYMIVLNVNFDAKPRLFEANQPSFIIAGMLWVFLILINQMKFINWKFSSAHLLITAFVILGAANFSSLKIATIQNKSDVSRAYMEVQYWAKQTTSNKALFMVDPCRVYGWRDFSGRASIGTVREWYMTAWIYQNRRDLLEKGKDIAGALDFNIEPFRGKLGAGRKICDAARLAYYDSMLDGQRRIAERFGVDYFVFEKAFAVNMLSKIEHKIEFQNDFFFVLAATRL